MNLNHNDLRIYKVRISRWAALSAAMLVCALGKDCPAVVGQVVAVDDFG